MNIKFSDDGNYVMIHINSFKKIQNLRKKLSQFYHGFNAIIETKKAIKLLEKEYKHEDYYTNNYRGHVDPL